MLEELWGDDFFSLNLQRGGGVEICFWTKNHIFLIPPASIKWLHPIELSLLLWSNNIKYLRVSRDKGVVISSGRVFHMGLNSVGQQQSSTNCRYIENIIDNRLHMYMSHIPICQIDSFEALCKNFNSSSDLVPIWQL